MFNKYISDSTVNGVTEKQIETTITKALIEIGIPIAYSKISIVDHEGILVGIELKEKS